MTGTLIEMLRQGVVNAEGRGNNGTRKRKKNKNRNNGEAVQARCVSQIPACEGLALTSCGDDAACLIALRACCQSLATCDFTEFITCANAAIGARN
jgi:hypothetical protein